jgi:predicted XRE-type DNA-binding protein
MLQRVHIRLLIYDPPRTPIASRAGDEPHRGLGTEQMTKTPYSSRRAFRDPGFVPGEAESLRVRAELIAIARRLIEERYLSQYQAAIIFGVAQPRVSNLVRGKIELFSADSLIEMLSRAGIRIEIRATHMPRLGSRAARDRVQR